MSKMSGDESEVVFDQPEKKAGAMEPDGPVPNRRKEEGWWEATEPYHGARPRTTKFDRPVDIGLGATIGGLERVSNCGTVKFRGYLRKNKFSGKRRYRRHRVGNYVETKVMLQCYQMDGAMRPLRWSFCHINRTMP